MTRCDDLKLRVSLFLFYRLTSVIRACLIIRGAPLANLFCSESHFEFVKYFADESWKSAGVWLSLASKQGHNRKGVR